MKKKSVVFPYQLKACNWELTLRCTMRCMHCGSIAGRARKNELDLDLCLGIAHELVLLGCEELTFIGGEVFLYSGWETIARFLSDCGVKVNIVTNGYHLTRCHIAAIRHGGLCNVGVSIDGMEKNHNKIRGKKDAFDEIKKTLDLLNESKTGIGAITSLLRFNYSDCEPLYRFLVKNNVRVWQLQLVNPMGNIADSKELLLDPAKIPLLTEFIREKNKDRKIVVIAADSIGFFDENETYIRGRSSPLCCWSGCQAGTASVFIDSIGNVKGCGALYADAFIEGNVRERSLTEIWKDKKSFAYNRKFKTGLLQGQCKACDYGPVCKGGCRSSNFFNTGSLYESAYCSRHSLH